MKARTHACPGCPTIGVPNRQLACTVCWDDMPDQLKLDLMESYRNRRLDPAEYYAIRAECLVWLRQHKSELSRRWAREA